jgi:hypothetical protein
MSDEDIVLYFDKKKSGAAKVCGTFRVDQVLENKKMIEIPIQTYFYAKTNHQKFLWMLFACMGMFFVSCDSKTKGEVKITVVDSLKNSKDEDTIDNKEILLTGDTIYSTQPNGKPKKIEFIETITGDVVENVSGFVGPPVRGGCVIPEVIEEETIVPDFSYIFKTAIKIFFILIVLYIGYMFYTIFNESILTFANSIFIIFDWLWFNITRKDNINKAEYYENIIKDKYNRIIRKTMI